MKKFFVCILSFVFIITGGLLSTQSLFQSFAENDNEEINITISSPEKFITTFNSPTTYNNQNVFIKLEEDLDFTNYDLSDIYQNKNIFSGTFDGNNNIITNVNFTSGSLYYGLIPYAKNATIKNLGVSGQISFEFDDKNINEIYAGILVGYGENIIIENCELYNVEVIINEETTENSNLVDEEISTLSEEKTTQVNLNIYSNVNFGSLAGKLTGNPKSSLNEGEANILNCNSYYDLNVQLNKNASVYIGGLVGQLEQAYILNCLSFGNINYTNNITTSENNLTNQFFGGIAGYVIGSKSFIKNCCYMGQISSSSNNSNLNNYEGGIVGGISYSNNLTITNINFDYFVGSYGAIGLNGENITSNYLTNIKSLTESFLKNRDNFDPSNPLWDFDKVWMITNSKIRLQFFQKFNYAFNSILDALEIIESATFIQDEEEVLTLSAKYDNIVYININLAEKYYGYYELNQILLNSTKVLDLGLIYSDYVVTNESGIITGYKIPVHVSDLTDGSYSFTLSAKNYNCLITISDEAKLNSEGGIRRVESSSLTEEMEQVFIYNSSVMSIIAVGKGIYSFDYWELYYIGNNGDLIKVDFEGDTQSTVTIRFGTEPFNKEFKLVAYFTSESAIKVNFSNVNKQQVKSIKIDGVLFEENDIAVSPNNSRLSLEIVTLKNYVLDYETFIKNISTTYGVNSIIMTNDPLKDETTSETTYKFSLDMRNIKPDNNQLSLSLNILKDDSSLENNLLWLYILIPVVVVVATGVVIFVIIKRRGGGKGKKKLKTKNETKNSSYKDYYV